MTDMIMLSGGEAKDGLRSCPQPAEKIGETFGSEVDEILAHQYSRAFGLLLASGVIGLFWLCVALAYAIFGGFDWRVILISIVGLGNSALFRFIFAIWKEAGKKLPKR